MTQPYNHALDPTWRLVYEARPSDFLTWSKQYPFGNTAIFNQEVETYLPANAYVSNNELILEGRNTGGGDPATGYGGKYTSGMVASYNCLSVLYGYIEAKIKFPSGYGIWPAFWMLYTTYPDNHEIDICEIFESPTTLNNGLHFPTGSGSDGGATIVANMSADYHYYAVDWQPGFVKWYFDGQLVRTITTAGEVPSQLMYILLNVALSGVAVGNHIPADGQFPVDMHVQYVRIWQSYGSQYQLVRSLTPNYANYDAAIRLDGATNSYKLSELTGPMAHDSIGSANGTITGGVTLNQTALLGDQSPSMLFDGTSGYIALPNTVNPAGLFAWTVETWFEFPATHHGGRLISNAHTDQTNTGFQLAVDSTSGGLASLATANKTANIYWSTVYATGRPYHYVMTYDGAHIYVYCNGVQVGNDTLTGAIVAGGLPINIGRGAYNNDYFQGLVSRTSFSPLALTPAQVSAHYAAGLATLTGPATLTMSDALVATAIATDIGVR